MRFKLGLPCLVETLLDRSRLYVLLLFGGVGLGASLNSILTKLNLTHLSMFLSPEMMTEAHQKWYCLTSPSFTTDAVIFLVSVLAICVFLNEVKEVKPDENDDTGGEV
jgi:hypothetical protein